MSSDVEVKRWYDTVNHMFSGSIPWDKLPEKSKEFWRQKYNDRPQERKPRRR